MRIPKLTSYDNSLDKKTVEIHDIEFEPKFYDLGNDKQRFKYITTIERLIRSSLEYTDLIAYLKHSLGMNFCSFFHKVNRMNFNKARIRIEVHHEPFTLYDIVSIVLNHRLDNDEPHDMFSICDEVVRLHYAGQVGLLPLSTTTHELVHSGRLFIPLQFIDQGFLKFFEQYEETIRDMDGLSDMLDAKLKLSKEFSENPEKFMEILKKKYIYVVNTDYDNLTEHIE